MVVDIGEVKRHIKPKADSTLYNMRKSDLIEYVRTLEHNYNVGATFLENQAKYIESLEMVQVVRCKDCTHFDERCRFASEETGEAWCSGYCYHWDYESGMSPNQVDGDDFCSYGERKDNGNLH